MAIDYYREGHRIRTGDLLLFTGRRPTSRLIQLWTRSPYSHVGVAVEVCAGTRKRLDVLEAMEGTGIRQYPLRQYVRSSDVDVDLYKVVDPDIDGDALVDFILDRRGTGYAWRQLVRSFVTWPLATWFGLSDRVEGERRFCSYLVAEALLAAGLPADRDDFQPHRVAPGDLTRLPGITFAGRITVNASASTRKSPRGRGGQSGPLGGPERRPAGNQAGPQNVGGGPSPRLPTADVQRVDRTLPPGSDSEELRRRPKLRRVGVGLLSI